MTYYLKIFGCQMNHSDAERITTILEKHKIKKASSIDEASLIIFVTCGVRQSAEDRVYGQINNIHRKYPEKIIILTGCLAHRKDVQRRLKEKVNLFCEIKIFPQKIKKILNTKYKIPDTKNDPNSNYLSITPTYTNKHTAYIPIMTGCDNFCSYCVVPHARGRERSRPAEDILKEVKSLVKKGCKEIILLGQNVNSYSSEFRTSNFESNSNSRIFNSKLSSLKSIKNSKFKIQNSGEINFANLLKLIELSIPGKYWLTFLTSHPKDMSDELIETIAKSEKISEYISLPVQSGDNEILQKMNRHYTVAHYKNLIKKIRRAFRRLSLRHDEGLTFVEKLPPAISTDIIVGFPGETKKQFENTARLMRKIKFDMAYVAQYSPRPQTAAWKLKDNIPKKEKERREKVLTEILKKTALANNEKYVGKVAEVLVDKEIRRLNLQLPKVEPSATEYLAHTRTQKKVIFYSDKKIPIGSFQKIKITKAKVFGLEGKLFNERT